MLKNDLYIIKTISSDNNSIEAVIESNEAHEIFKGHFPSQPVLPGACILQMIREIIETSLNNKLQLKIANDIKFLSMIIPDKNKLLQFSIQYDLTKESTLNINAKILKDEVMCCKMKASYQTK